MSENFDFFFMKNSLLLRILIQQVSSVLGVSIILEILKLSKIIQFFSKPYYFPQFVFVSCNNLFITIKYINCYTKTVFDSFKLLLITTVTVIIFL